MVSGRLQIINGRLGICGGKLATGDGCCKKRWLLEDCADVAPDIITAQDLSAYEGLVVLADDGICYAVSKTSAAATGTVTVLDSFTSCSACLNRVYYLLTICAAYSNPPVPATFTTKQDLSAYTIVRLSNAFCYTVSTTQVFGNDTVSVVQGYDECPDCVGTAPCVPCSATQDDAVGTTEGAGCGPDDCTWCEDIGGVWTYGYYGANVWRWDKVLPGSDMVFLVYCEDGALCPPTKPPHLFPPNYYPTDPLVADTWGFVCVNGVMTGTATGTIPGTDCRWTITL